MENKCKRLVAFPTNNMHKALASLHTQTFYGNGSLTFNNELLSFIYFRFGGFLYEN